MLSQVRLLLNEVKSWKTEIGILDLEIEDIKNDYIHAIAYGERTGATNKINRQNENIVISNEDKIRELNQKKRSLEISINVIEKSLGILTDIEREVIEYKYLSDENNTWRDVTYKLHSRDVTVKRAEKRALRKMLPMLTKHSRLRMYIEGTQKVH
ncbi:DUF722 domain-containing protein [Clostridium hydrogeniformans]|uniref:DUF722 domain-containing protein n=1 Tax=Clostridium hydrogeniformans TaxID=349933 RepID=UPI00048A2F04|nr:DUF722 domain-containing protein [Clostridium hydrogeniformans]